MSSDILEVIARGIKFRAKGHPNIRATHRSTFEITREDYLTTRGDCIIGVGSEVASSDLPEWFKEAITREDSRIIAILCTNNICDVVIGRGSPKLILSDNTRMVFRKSTYIGPETIMIGASKAAGEIRRDLINKLVTGGVLEVTILVV
ncbi:MAG: DUF371 domain-containing protein [Acidilobaceae archaeon]